MNAEARMLPAVERTAVDKQDVVLITGCSGLIGSRLARALSRDFRIVGFDLDSPPKALPLTEWISCDLTKDADVARACRQLRQNHGQRLASVLHLAAYYDFSGEPSPLYDELTVRGTGRLLKELQALEVEQFIFSSSLLVMKPAENGERLTENSPTEAPWDYPRSKLQAELVIANERGNVPVVILRIAGVYDEDGHSIPIGQQISRIYEKQFESYFFPGDKTRGQSFVHLDDLCACIRQSIERRDELGQYEMFLIGEEDVMSYDELQEEIGRQLHGQAWPTIRIPKAVAKVGAWVQDKMAGSDEGRPFIKPWMIDMADQHYPVSGALARDKLAWQPKHSLRTTLPEMIRRLRDDPRGWYAANKLPLPASIEEPKAPEEAANMGVEE
jgi:nucleoside-diphosphate-sugar epimerase